MEHTSRPAGTRRLPGMRRVAAVAAVAVLTLVGAACGGDDSSSSNEPVDTSVLGPTQVASGTPIKIGTLSDGQTPAFDNTIQIDAAKAVATFLNEHRGGIGGHPIELVVCETQGDPGKASDCANQLIQADIAIAVFGEIANMAQVWRPLHDAKIPVFTYASTEAPALADQDSTFILANQVAGLADVPIGVAKENGLKKVTAIVIDVPAATDFYETTGKKIFADAGVELKLVKVPLGTADMSPQMADIVSGGPTEVHIIGNDSFCIAAFNGLRAVNFTGPISTLNRCATDSVRKAIGSGLEGVTMGATAALGEDTDKDIQQWTAIAKTYGDDIDLSNSMGPTIYMTFVALHSALEGITGDLTPDALVAKIKAAPSMPVPAGGELAFRCNGKARPLMPAVCIRGTLLTSLDEDGNPVLPYRATGNTPIED
ncbi:ABC transporter substrate-binding protein [Frankia sp. CNm7]|uniref:ABC transporter substrate-binding protein n=1 Tax=Frankia nepalensis TaxID=1836974 RepID=A0A937RJY3_9ACTN|nr:ABC transporter substrate-binding protein [Frankia nepalensis]MBL7500223.1 ABC transporter substrate-binding protein [Frankia nepalensis]MBL7514602.1 ABC transporter substrate-binding protein [Frankia nepalensis]MBL7524312.1 ABC transporter substrate-binding protein [Frankia nepalensis]MBL7631685.1 ABC transporter substrate-binding protein [Frankia nepalensis]